MSRLPALAACACALVLLLMLALPDGAHAIRMMTYNVQNGCSYSGAFNLSEQARVIREQKVHLIGLQELDNNTGRHPGVDEARVLSQLAALPHVVYGRMRTFEGGGYGVAVLSALAFEDTRVFHYAPPAPGAAGGAAGGGGERSSSGSASERCVDPEPNDFCQGVVAVKVRDPDTGACLWFATTHLGLTTQLKDTWFVQTAEAKQLVAFLQSLAHGGGGSGSGSGNGSERSNGGAADTATEQCAVFVTGDLNAVPDAPPVRDVLIESGAAADVWAACAAQAPDARGWSFNSHAPFERIDYLFALQSQQQQQQQEQRATLAAKCVSGTVPATEASDHRPVVFELAMTATAAAKATTP